MTLPLEEGIDVARSMLRSGARTDVLVALQVLAGVADELGGRAVIQDLMDMYLTYAVDELVSARVLYCLRQSRDKRCLGLFQCVLDGPTGGLARAEAALGLAQFNIRLGVESSIELMNSGDVVDEHGGTVGGYVTCELTRLCETKESWRCPLGAVALREMAGQIPASKWERKWQERWRVWFAQVSSRFPSAP